MIHSFLALLGKGSRGRGGVAAVEFAIIAPVLIMLLGGAVDIGTAVDRSIRLENAARTAAQYVTRAPADSAGAQSAAMATLAGMTGASVTVGAMACRCPATGSAVGGAVVDCGTTCATGMVKSITVTATRPFAPIFPTSAIIPFNNLGATTSNVVVRLQ